MAGITPTAPVVTAPPAPAPDETEEIELPDGMTLEDFERPVGDEAETEGTEPGKKPEAAAAPAAPAGTVPAPAPTEPTPPERKGDVSKALKEERRKRKEAAARAETAERKVNLYEEIERQRKQGTDRLAHRPELGAITVADVTLNLDEAIRAAEEADTALALPSKPVSTAIRKAAQLTAAALQSLQRDGMTKLRDEHNRYQLTLQENTFREELAEQGHSYDDVLHRAGVFDGLQRDAQGNFRDPYLAQKVWSSAHPFRKAYRIAIDKLEYESRANGRPAGEEPEDDEPPTPAPRAKAADATPTRLPAGQTAEALAEARRQGAQDAIEAVDRHTSRPRGVKVLRPAGGPPSAVLDRQWWERLNWMVDHEPEKADDFFRKNPAHERFYLGGRPAA